MKDQAIALHRISSVGQSEGHSLEAQELSTQKMAEELNVPIVNSWSVIQSSNKGKNFRRKDVEEMLRYCRQNKRIGYLLIDFVNRLMREVEVMIYYKVLLNELGVKLVFCDPSQQNLNGDDQYAQLMLLIEGYKTEQENKMRADTSISRMKTRIEAGYYLSHPRPGYMKSETPGKHIKDPKRFNLLQSACKLIVHKQYTIPQAVKWLNEQGYRTLAGKKLDVGHFSDFIINRYYCGIIDIASEGWPKGVVGKHERMLTTREHSLLTTIITKRNPRIRQKHNPEFALSNLLRHYECKGHGQYEKFTGHYRNPGKRPSGSQRPSEAVYDCRDCRKRLNREKVHASFSSFLQSLEFIPSKKSFRDSLIKVWKNQRGSMAQRLKTLEINRGAVEKKIKDTTESYAREQDEDIKNTFRKLLKDYDNELKEIEIDIHEATNKDMASEGFVKFAIDFVDEMREKWWGLSWENMARGEQILFNGKIYADNSTIVHPTNLSSIYRLGTNKKALENVSNAHLVELVGTAPTSAGLSLLVVYRLVSFYGLKQRLYK